MILNVYNGRCCLFLFPNSSLYGLSAVRVGITHSKHSIQVSNFIYHYLLIASAIVIYQTCYTRFAYICCYFVLSRLNLIVSSSGATSQSVTHGCFKLSLIPQMLFVLYILVPRMCVTYIGLTCFYV